VGATRASAYSDCRYRLVPTVLSSRYQHLQIVKQLADINTAFLARLVSKGWFSNSQVVEQTEATEYRMSAKNLHSHSIFMKYTTWFTVIVSSTLLTACVQVRMLTYPDGFTYLDSDTVKSTMLEMAIALNRVSELIDKVDDAENNQLQQDAIVSKLADVEQLAISLSTGIASSASGVSLGIMTNHLLIDENLDAFINSAMRARQMAELSPPNYFAAGKLSGNCNACHRIR